MIFVKNVLENTVFKSIREKQLQNVRNGTKTQLFSTLTTFNTARIFEILDSALSRTVLQLAQTALSQGKLQTLMQF